VRHRAESVAKFTVPLKALLNRFSLLLLIFSAFTIVLLGKAENYAVERVRSGVIDMIAPVLDGLSRPITTISAGIDRAEYFFSVYEQNSRLREQNARLLKWQSAARALDAENQAFRKMLNFAPEKTGVTFSTARIIADSGGVFARSALINAGSASGIDRGDAVISGEGLVGRVAGFGRRSARVLMITDLNSRIPVVSQEGRVRAILSGDNSSTLKLGFITPNARLNLGDRIVTSGQGGVFPAGLPVGIIFSIEDGVIRVAPFTNFDLLEYVRVITDFPGNISDQPTPSTTRTSRMK